MISLMLKSIDFAKRGSPLSILSVTQSKAAEGYVYVEAFKEMHVREAVKGLSIFFGGKMLLVPTVEMSGIYSNSPEQAKVETH